MRKGGGEEEEEEEEEEEGGREMEEVRVEGGVRESDSQMVLFCIFQTHIFPCSSPVQSWKDGGQERGEEEEGGMGVVVEGGAEEGKEKENSPLFLSSSFGSSWLFPSLSPNTTPQQIGSLCGVFKTNHLSPSPSPPPPSFPFPFPSFSPSLTKIISFPTMTNDHPICTPSTPSPSSFFSAKYCFFPMIKGGISLKRESLLIREIGS